MMFHPVEVAFQSIHVSRPEPPELGQPGIDFLKRARFQPVETALCVHDGLHETSFPQHSQMFRYGRLRHAKLALNLSDRLLRRDEKAQDRPPVRFRNDFEY